MENSLIILYATPFFLIFIFAEYLYGLSTNKSTYRINDTSMSLSIGIFSRFPQILNISIATYVYDFIYQQTKINPDIESGLLIWLTAFIIYDFLFYWSHRARHRINILWAAHCVHHHGEDYNLATALRQTGSGFFLTWVFFIPSFLIGFSPELFFTVGSINLVYQFWVHTEHIGKLGLLEKFLVTPSNHRVHHAQNSEYIDSNYGGVFIIWDRMFGTFVEENLKNKPVYGTIVPLKSWNPVWANIQIYHKILIKMIKKNKMGNKIKFIIKPPSWSPETKIVSQTNQNLSNFEKYNPNVSNKMKNLILFFLILNITSASILFFNLENLNYLEISICSIYLTISMIISGLIAEGKSINRKYEIFRCSISILIFLIFSNNILINQIYITHSLIMAFMILFMKKNSI